MTVRELFNCLNTDVPEVSVYDFHDNLIYSKPDNQPVGKFPYWEKQVAWIRRADSSEIILKLEGENEI